MTSRDVKLRNRLVMAASAALLAATGTLAWAAPAEMADPHLVPMDEISVPIVDGGRVDGAFTVKMVLGTADPAAAERITAALPRLRSVSLGAALEFSRLYASPFRPVDAEHLSRDLTEALHGADAGISRVLIVEVAARSGAA